MIIKQLVKIKYLNTFFVDVCALRVVQVYTENDLLIIWKRFVQEGFFVLLLGGCSNVLFLENYNGIILLNRIKGVNIFEGKKYWYLHVCAGELWHELVVYSLKKNIPGLENLALIPGYVGAAPIQNIGAYGVELQRFCEYVDVLNLDINKKIRFMAHECRFDYRNSIFNDGIGFNYAIVAVGLKLRKQWSPVLGYHGLEKFNARNSTPLEIFNTICMIRKKKFQIH